METSDQMERNTIDRAITDLLYEGTVIPAHPLALKKGTKEIDENGLRQITRYYLHSGAGGVAAAVHTTQFEIRNKEFGLLPRILEIISDEIDRAGLSRPFIKVAGVCGKTDQAVAEAALAQRHGYHFALLSMGGLAEYTESQLIDRARAVSRIMPLFGFYLQPAVGGRILSYEFWKEFASLDNVYAIKVAAFNRYHTIDVVKAVCASPRSAQIALYTGNDDNIVNDLLTPYRFMANGVITEKRFAGGLLGHWAFCTSDAVRTLHAIKACLANNYAGIEELLVRGVDVTNTNAAVFDVDHHFHGCIAGIHEMLRREGVMNNTECLLEKEKLSPGQLEKINDVCLKYFPDLAS